MAGDQGRGRILKSLPTYGLPALIIALGAGLWLWAFLGGAGLSSDQSSDVMNVGSGILSGGIVAMVVVWIEHRFSARQQETVELFQLSTQSNLVGLDLRGRNLKGMYLAGKDLSSARLTDATLDLAVLTGATLSSADLSGSSMIEAILIDANLKGAYLSGAVLDRANLIDTNFDGATLIGASFRNATVSGASFEGADGSGAEFTGSGLTDTQISQFETPPAKT